MAKRTGPSISVKMILTSTLLILLIVVGFGVLSVMNVRAVYDKTAEEKTAEFTVALKNKGETTTLVFSAAVNLQLIDNQDAAIFGLAEKSAKQDPDIKLIYVLDYDKKIVAYCEVLREGSKICDMSKYGSDGTDLPLSPHPDVNEETWTSVQTEWQSRLESNDPTALVQFRAKVGPTPVQIFAYPVFKENVVPTPKSALTDERPDNRMGYVVLGYDLSEIEAFAAKNEKAKKDASYKSALRTGAAGALFVLVGTLLAIFQGLSISKPLKLLAWKADQIARGDLEARVEVSSTDEIGLLGENFNFMADQLVVLLHQTAEKAHMEKELEVARTIQDTLVPPNDPIDMGFLNFAGYFQPAQQCGGDWWTYHELVDNKLLVVIGDVTGHGVPSAMITATAKAACDVARSVHHDDVAVTTLLEIMNDAIFQSAKRKFVMTCFASIIDPAKGTITYANAGHNFPYLYRVNENGRGEFGSLMIRGNRLGDIKESQYEVKTTELRSGDTLIWYTDGIVECENEQGEEYGEKRFRASIRRAGHLSAGELRDTIVNDSFNFFGEMPRKDDITMVIGRIA